MAVPSITFVCALMVIFYMLPAVQGSSIHLECALEHCGKQMLAAMETTQFYEMALCQNKCTEIYKTDPTPGKLHYQNCTTTCAFTYETPAGDAFTSCAMTYGCISLPPIPGSCPKPQVDSTSSLKSLEGEWWQHFGHNQLWDCYPCQHIHAMQLVNDTEFCAKTKMPNGKPIQAPCWSYTYSYDLYLADGTTKPFEQTWQLPGNIEPGNPIEIYYTYMGSLHNETWYILHQTPRYVVLVDCSYMYSWINVGSIVWVRPNVTLTNDELSDISQVYQQRLGWHFPQDFCDDVFGPSRCVNPSKTKTTNLPHKVSAPWIDEAVQDVVDGHFLKALELFRQNTKNQ